MIQKYSASIVPLSDFQKELADLNNDAKVNILDSKQIQKQLAGLSTENSKDDDKPIELPIIPVIR